jgi:hypothetical protein
MNVLKFNSLEEKNINIDDEKTFNQSSSKGEIILYQPDTSLKLEVRLEDETVWLSQAQMAELFQTTIPNINLHLKNIFEEGELEELRTIKDFLIVQKEGKRQVQRRIFLYNLDAIISVGYRIKSQIGTQFRIWATQVIKDYLLRGYAINCRIEQVEKFAIETEKRVAETEKKIDFFVKTSLPPLQGIFFDGEIFNAYNFASDLIKSAAKSVVLIDNYIDETVLLLLSKRAKDVSATIYTATITPQLQLDLQKHNTQNSPINIKIFTRSHDRFLLLDNLVYHIGASLKDLGKKWFAFSKMEIGANVLLQHIF